MLISCDFSLITPFNALNGHFFPGLKKLFSRFSINLRYHFNYFSCLTLQWQLHDFLMHHSVATCLFAGIGHDYDDQNSTTITMTMITMITTVVATKNCILQQTEIFPANKNIRRHLVFEVNLQGNTFARLDHSRESVDLLKNESSGTED